MEQIKFKCLSPGIEFDNAIRARQPVSAAVFPFGQVPGHEISPSLGAFAPDWNSACQRIFNTLVIGHPPLSKPTGCFLREHPFCGVKYL